MKKKMLVLICILVMIPTIVIVGCEIRTIQEERAHMEYISKKMQFARRVRFTTDVENNSPIFSVAGEFNRRRNSPDEENYVDVVFVHSAEEAVEFPDNTLVAWPSTGFMADDGGHRRGTREVIDDLADYVRVIHPDVDLRDFGLPENTITVYDAVERWEIVAEIFEAFPW